MSVCETCKSIPFGSLPAENEPAFAHQPSLEALAASAQQCPLCRIIQEAVVELRKNFEDERNQKPVQRFVVFSPPDKETGIATERFFGPALPADLSALATPKEGDGAANAGKAGQRPRSKLFGRKEKQPRYDVVRPWLFGNWWVMEGGESAAQPDYKLIGVGVRISKTPDIVDAEGNDAKHVRLRGSQLRVRTLDDAPAAAYIPSRLRSVDCWSGLCLKRIAHWVTTCSEKHNCGPAAKVLPTRLLDLGTERNVQSIKLVDCRDLPFVPYVALSHCWGTSHRITTTKAKLVARKSGIPMVELPTTFRDAVLITRYLNVRYLWIDSLCIIQDDLDDWEHEASLMGGVYANSFLAIAASSSRDDASGCLPSLNTRQNTPHFSPDSVSMALPSLPDVPPYLVERPGQEPMYLARQNLVPISTTNDLPSPAGTPPANRAPSNLVLTKEWMPSSTKIQPFVYKIGRFGVIYDPLAAEPLNSRGWTLQERLLAPRTLHYGSNQVFWECRDGGLLAEDGTPFPPSFFSVESVLHGQRMPFEHHGLPVGGRQLNLMEGLYHNVPRHGRWERGWLGLVQNYSARAITKPGDKLVALAGLVRVLAERTGDKYLAGLWYAHIEEDLCWRVYAREEVHASSTTPQQPQLEKKFGRTLSGVSRPDKYRAPSWSWAAVDASVLFVQLNFDHIVARFEGGYVEPVGKDMYGQLKAAWIQLRAPLLPLHPLSPPRKALEPFGVPVEISCAAGIAPGSAFLDEGSEATALPADTECFALFLDWGNALVVVKADGRLPEYPGGEEDDFQLLGRKGEEYKRIGLARFIWTPSQREKAYGGGLPAPGSMSRGIQCHGPITDADERTLVTLI